MVDMDPDQNTHQKNNPSCMEIEPLDLELYAIIVTQLTKTWSIRVKCK
jgi:hypothetical protein